MVYVPLLVPSPTFDTDSERAEIRALVATLYRAISGDAGAPRDWDALARLFVDGGRLTVFRNNAASTEILTPEMYAQTRAPIFATNAFFEVEVGHDATIAGRLAHAFSRYEARRMPDGPAVANGVNSIQLVRTPQGWRIVSIAWEFTGLGKTD